MEQAGAVDGAPEVRTFQVQGMTCEHCVASVTEEVGDVDGVDSVAVDLASGRVRVTGRGFSDEAVISSVEDAGYTVPS